MRPGKMIKQVVQSFFKKPATNLYPYEKLDMPAKIRGKLKFHPEKCIGCKLCMKDCPSGAITINDTGNKQFEAVIDLGKCMYCAQCADSCLKKALEFTDEIELAQLDKERLRVVFRAESEGGNQKQA